LYIHHTGDITINEVEKQVIENIIIKTIPQKYLSSDTKFIINPISPFTTGSSVKCGSSGRNLFSESYGNWIIAENSFSGKDPSNLTRTGSYMARLIAKSLVKNGFCSRCKVKLEYPTALYNTEE